MIDIVPFVTMTGTSREGARMLPIHSSEGSPVMINPEYGAPVDGFTAMLVWRRLIGAFAPARLAGDR